MEIGYKVRTESFDDGDIHQTLEFHDKGVVQKLSEQVVRTQDHDVKNALIKLGWKPPKDTYVGNRKQKIINTLNNLLWYETILSDQRNDIAKAIELLGGDVDEYDE